MAGSRLFVCAVAMAAFVGPAAAQVASSSGSRVVMDPETRRARVINPLDGLDADYQPPAIQEPIILKKPKRHRAKAAPPKIAETPVRQETSPPAETAATASSNANSLDADDYVSPIQSAPAAKPAPTKAAQKPKPKAPPAPEPATDDTSTIPFSFGSGDDYGASLPATPKLQQHAIAGKAKPAERSSVGQVRNIHINFTPGAAEPTADVAAALQSLAGTLSNELQEKSGRLLLQAFAGAPGDKSSDARRLSLKRALAVRQVLIDSGVPSDKIDVRAMGGITDGGKPDRVDVILKS